MFSTVCLLNVNSIIESPKFGVYLKYSLDWKQIFKLQLFFMLDPVFTVLRLPWTFTSLITVNGSQDAMLSNNILHNKHAIKEILLETSVVVTNFTKNFVGKKVYFKL